MEMLFQVMYLVGIVLIVVFFTGSSLEGKRRKERANMAHDEYERRMCKKCGYVLHRPTVIRGLFGKEWLAWACLMCGRKRKGL